MKTQAEIEDKAVLDAAIAAMCRPSSATKCAVTER